MFGQFRRRLAAFINPDAPSKPELPPDTPRFVAVRWHLPSGVPPHLAVYDCDSPGDCAAWFQTSQLGYVQVIVGSAHDRSALAKCDD